MKNSNKIIIPTLIALLAIGGIVNYNIKNPIIKGLYGSREVIEYNGQSAIIDAFYSDFTEAEYLGRTEDKNFKVYAYRDGYNYNLFTLVGSDNTDCYKMEGFTIPTSGDVTKVFMDPAVRSNNNKVSKNQTDIEMFKELVSYHSDERIYHINNIFTEGTEIYFAYNSCPVATFDNLVVYIAYIDDNWIIVSPEHYRGRNNEKNSNHADLMGSQITESKLIEWLNKNSTEVAPPSYTEKS